MDIVVQNVNEAYVKVLSDLSIAHELSDFFQFMVPGAQFSPKFRAKLWNGKIYLFNTQTRQIYRGLVNQIEQFASDRGYTFKYDSDHYDASFSVKECDDFIESINPKYLPRDYQKDAFITSIRNKRRLILSPTASGKSLIIYLIVRYLLESGKKKGLIIVPKISLVEQLTKDFTEYSENNGWDTDENVHKIYQGKEKTSNKAVTISTWQSIYKISPKELEKYDFVIGDECHLFTAKSLTTIMTSLKNTEYRIGTTGTLDGSKTHKMVLEGLFGPVYKGVTTKELMDNNHIADFSIKCLLLKHPEEVCKAAKTFTYQQEMEYLVLNDTRNLFVSNLALSLKGNTLILYQYVEKHGVLLHDIIQKKIGKRKLFFIHGAVNVDYREKVREVVEKENDAIIVASYGTYSTGINIRNLHNVIFASPSKSRIRNLQSIGRSLRKSDTKSEAVLFDIADDLRHKKKENYTLKHFISRTEIYMDEKFKFKIYKIDIKG